VVKIAETGLAIHHALSAVRAVLLPGTPQTASGTGDDYSLLLQTEHWLEACDHKHRYGSNLKPYFKAWLEAATHQSFFKWLDEGDGVDVDILER
jgi:hypothetical protein